MVEFYNALEEVILCITNSLEYQKCLTIKEKMGKNEELMSMIRKVKELQKKYVKSHYDENIKKELDDLESQLNEIPIYVVYLQNLEIVNEKIEYVKDSLNDYFYQLFNE